MKDFLNRNKPVFIIGFVTVLIFLGIIYTAQNSTPQGPTLRKIENVNLLEKYTPTRGTRDPKITLVEFSDFECPACKAFHPIIEQLTTKYSKYMLVAFRNFPLPQHTQAKQAAIAAQAAAEQGKFWEYANKLFENQPNFSQDNLIKYAEELGLNVEKFKNDLNNPLMAQQVDTDLSTGNKIGLDSTPSFVINNKLVQFTSPDDIETAIKDELKKLNISYNSNTESNLTANESSQTTQTAIQPTGEVVTINYTNNGFEPNNLGLKLGTTVKFVNNVDRDIVIRQIIDTYPEFRNVRMIKKGDTFSFILTQKDLWTFKEDATRHYGSIFVKE
jgi:protein-disulfide isomerase